MNEFFMRRVVRAGLPFFTFTLLWVWPEILPAFELGVKGALTHGRHPKE